MGLYLMLLIAVSFGIMVGFLIFRYHSEFRLVKEINNGYQFPAGHKLNKMETRALLRSNKVWSTANGSLAMDVDYIKNSPSAKKIYDSMNDYKIDSDEKLLTHFLGTLKDFETAGGDVDDVNEFVLSYLNTIKNGR
jgi:hypothetical protein